ncbi:MAG: C40 family peptidase [Desulfovibrio sp.]|nr:C40 family peptidase [Desulfovibrio sp.]
MRHASFVEKILFFQRLCCGVLLVLSMTACGFFQSSDQNPERGGVDGVLKTAYSQIGKKYRAGGSSPKKGFDCSGFTYWVYRENGYKIPRISADQAKAGNAVSRKKAKKGDLLVFRVQNSPRGLHTGICTGRNRFIHSPSKGKSIKIDRLDNGYWKDKLIAVRRIVRN